MDGYRLALFGHLLALLAATAMAAMIHVAYGRRVRAASVREALQWQATIGGIAKNFPIALVTLVLTGGYMTGRGTTATWSSGFVIAGLTGSLLLFGNGLVLRAKGAALARQLVQRMQGGGADQAPDLPADTFVRTLMHVNHGIVLGIVFDMATKPAPAWALGALVGWMALGAALGLRGQPVPAVEALEPA